MFSSLQKESVESFVEATQQRATALLLIEAMHNMMKVGNIDDE